MAIEMRGEAKSEQEALTDVGLSRRSFLSLTGAAGGALALSGLLAACSSSGGGSKSTGASKSSGGGTLTLGEIYALTGPAASTYEHYFLSVGLALDEINAAGGIGGANVQTKTYDDQAEAAQEPVVFRKLAQEKIHYAIGPISSTANLAAAPIATSSKILQLSVCIADQLTDASKYPYAYVIGPTNSQAVQAMVNYAKTQNWKKIVLLHEDSAYGTDPIAPLQTAAAAAGMTVTMIQHPAMTTNMAPYVGKVKDADPDVVIIFQEILATEVAMFTAFDNLNYNPPKMGTQGSGTKSVITSIPAAQVSTLLVTSWQNFSYPAGGSSASIPANSLAYVNKVKAKLGDFGGLTIAGLAYGIYDFPFMLQSAIKQAGSQDPDKVRAVLDSMPVYDGVIGKIKFSSTNHNGLDASEFAICKAASASSPNSLGGYILERA